MTKITKVLLTIIVVVIIILGLWMIFGGSSNGKSTADVSINETPAVNQVKQNQTPPNQTPVVQEPQVDLTPTGISNDSLDKDLKAIDTQLSGVDTNTANVDKGINDKPITQ
ncbi:MAG: hypothetical protein NTV72_03455 [Candidatus Taylorbacteria bacterium]|nr:hypothetical protein [Candidatus Taylorbacteria bacterium]